MRSTFFSKKGSRGSKLGENQNWISFLWRCFKGKLPRVQLLWAHDKSLTAIHSVLKWMHKYLKAYLDYCGDPTRSCEIFVFLPKQNRSTEWEAKTFWEVAWFFSAACHLRQIGRKIQVFSTFCQIFTIIHLCF